MSSISHTLNKTRQSFLLNEGLTNFASHIHVKAEPDQLFSGLIIKFSDIHQLDNPSSSAEFKFQSSIKGELVATVKRNENVKEDFYLMLVIPEHSPSNEIPVTITVNTIEIPPPSAELPKAVPSAPVTLPTRRAEQAAVVAPPIVAAVAPAAKKSCVKAVSSLTSAVSNNKGWIIGAIVVVFILMLAAYFFYKRFKKSKAVKVPKAAKVVPTVAPSPAEVISPPASKSPVNKAVEKPAVFIGSPEDVVTLRSPAGSGKQ